MAGWANSGFDSIDETAQYDSSGGGGGGKRFLDFWTPYTPEEKGGPTTKLIILLDDVPFCFWQHGLYAFGKKSSEKEICLERNKIEPKCPVCEVAKEKKTWPSFVGYLTVIDCGEVIFGKEEDDKERLIIDELRGWDNKKQGNDHRVWQFGKKLARFAKGSKDKPGLLMRLRRMKERKGGSLVGTVWTVTRHGQKEEVVGTEWGYRGRVDVSSAEALKNSLMSLPGSPLASIEDPNIKELTTDVLEYDKHFVPKGYAQLAAFLGIGQVAPSGGNYGEYGQQNGGGGSSADLGGSTGDQDDDIPF